ncbi:ferredoxin domain-containing protein [candidate division KSB1 bacterium]
MAIIKSDQAEKAAIDSVAQRIMVSLRTSPKTRGVDDIVALIIDGPELERLADLMEKKSAVKGPGIAPAFKRDAGCVRRAQAVVLVGTGTLAPKKPGNPIDCGACGYESCAEFMGVEETDGEDYPGPSCIWQLVDLGIALGSAVKTAADADVDNRLMYTVGAAAREMGVLDCQVAVGIPLSVSGKNIFFDRG